MLGGEYGARGWGLLSDMGGLCCEGEGVKGSVSVVQGSGGDAMGGSSVAGQHDALGTDACTLTMSDKCQQWGGRVLWLVVGLWY